jgi:hypothetical protein
MSDYESLAKAAGWQVCHNKRFLPPYYKESYDVEDWFRHPKDGEWKRNADGSFACIRADGSLDPEYIMASSAKEACEKDGLT